MPMPYEYSQYLYYTSHLIGISSLISLYHQDYKTFLFMFILCLSSINYWVTPDYGILRNIDLFLAKTINLYFYGNTLVFKDEYAHTVFVNALYSVLFFYCIEQILVYNQDPKWIIFHMMIHFYLSIFTPFVLYIL